MHHDIIKSLGGAKAVGDALRARGLQVEDVTVRSWTLGGRTIPAKYWVHMAEISAEAGLVFSIEEAARAAAASPEPSAPGDTEPSQAAA